MMLNNPHRQSKPLCPSAPFPSIDAQTPRALLARCPIHAPTPLVRTAFDGTSARFFLKDERSRMGLGSFKALGAAYVIAHMAQSRNLADITYITPSAGNHGLSVAAGAKTFGARAVVFLSASVPETFARRLQDIGAEVRRAGENYEESMAAAMQTAEENGWFLLSDTSWPDYYETPLRLMEGYLTLAAEATEQMDEPPTDIFLQAGVGGLATACAAFFRSVWGDAPKIYIVEPESAPALHHSIRAGRAVSAPGPVSSMGRLDCKEPSLIALNGLARDADGFILLSDAEVEGTMATMARADCATTPSGGAGLAAALLQKVPLSADARVLCVLSEAA